MTRFRIPSGNTFGRTLNNQALTIPISYLGLVGLALTLTLTMSCKDAAFGGGSPTVQNQNSRSEGGTTTKPSSGRGTFSQPPAARDEDSNEPNQITGLNNGGTTPTLGGPSFIQSVVNGINSIATNAIPPAFANGPANNGGTDASGNQPGENNDTITYAQPGLSPCSVMHQVPGTANPYLAGVSYGTSITYDISKGGGPDPLDTTSKDYPVLVQTNGNCISEGKTLVFKVRGLITYDRSVAAVNANGKILQTVSHQKGPYLGKANITAPYCALLGVFVGDADPTNNTPPAALDFSTPAARDYVNMTPVLGQIFFIGTGITSKGSFHQIIVPTGAKRLFLGVMDSHQWNNNLGGLNAQICGLTN